MEELLNEKLERVIEEKFSEEYPNKLINKIDFIMINSERKIEFFNSIDEAKQFLDIAMEGVNNLDEYLSEAEYLAEREFHPERDIDFQLPTCYKDFDEPRLNSFYYDQRIIVKPVKNFVRETGVSANVFFDGGIYKCNFKLVENKSMKLRRWYGLEEIAVHEKDREILESFITVQRFPILFNTNFINDEFYKHSYLAYDILSNQLEPFTTQNVLKQVKKMTGREDSEISEEDFKKIKKQKLGEEDLVCDAIIRGWLYESGFNGDDVFSHGPADIPTKERNKAFKQIIKKRPENVISYYGGRKWNLKNFLDGDF